MAENDRENNYARVIDFPKEVRVYGNISHVYIEGKNKHSTLIIDQSPPENSTKKEKSSKEPVLIVPIKKTDSELQFVRVPFYKLSKHPRGEKVGYSRCPKVDVDDEGVTTDHIARYATDLYNFPRADLSNGMNREYNTCFIFHESDPLKKDLFTNLPIADLFHFQKNGVKEIKSPPESRDKEVQFPEWEDEQRKSWTKKEKRKSSNKNESLPERTFKDEMVQVSEEVPIQRRMSAEEPDIFINRSRSYISYLVTPKKDRF